LYLYFSLIKAPTFLIENDLPQSQVLNDLKSLEDQLQNSQEKKQTWNISFFSNPFKSKVPILKEDNSQMGSKIISFFLFNAKMISSTFPK